MNETFETHEEIDLKDELQKLKQEVEDNPGKKEGSDFAVFKDAEFEAKIENNTFTFQELKEHRKEVAKLWSDKRTNYKIDMVKEKIRESIRWEIKTRLVSSGGDVNANKNEDFFMSDGKENLLLPREKIIQPQVGAIFTRPMVSIFEDVEISHAPYVVKRGDEILYGEGQGGMIRGNIIGTDKMGNISIESGTDPMTGEKKTMDGKACYIKKIISTIDPSLSDDEIIALGDAKRKTRAEQGISELTAQSAQRAFDLELSLGELSTAKEFTKPNNEKKLTELILLKLGPAFGTLYPEKEESGKIKEFVRKIQQELLPSDFRGTQEDLDSRIKRSLAEFIYPRMRPKDFQNQEKQVIALSGLLEDKDLLWSVKRKSFDYDYVRQHEGDIAKIFSNDEAVMATDKQYLNEVRAEIQKKVANEAQLRLDPVEAQILDDERLINSDGKNLYIRRDHIIQPISGKQVIVTNPLINLEEIDLEHPPLFAEQGDAIVYNDGTGEIRGRISAISIFGNFQLKVAGTGGNIKVAPLDHNNKDQESDFVGRSCYIKKVDKVPDPNRSGEQLEQYREAKKTKKQALKYKDIQNGKERELGIPEIDNINQKQILALEMKLGSLNTKELRSKQEYVDDVLTIVNVKLGTMLSALFPKEQKTKAKEFAQRLIQTYLVPSDFKKQEEEFDAQLINGLMKFNHPDRFLHKDEYPMLPENGVIKNPTFAQMLVLDQETGEPVLDPVTGEKKTYRGQVPAKYLPFFSNTPSETDPKDMAEADQYTGPVESQPPEEFMTTEQQVTDAPVKDSEQQKLALQEAEKKAIETTPDQYRHPFATDGGVENHQISDTFHKRKKHPILGIPAMHWGVDVSGVYKEVSSATNGRVVDVGKQSGYGNRVVVESRLSGAKPPGKYYILYAHLQKPLVKEGDLVEAGKTKIGISGKSGVYTDKSGKVVGYITQPHLHFEVRPAPPESFSNATLREPWDAVKGVNPLRADLFFNLLKVPARPVEPKIDMVPLHADAVSVSDEYKTDNPIEQLRTQQAEIDRLSANTEKIKTNPEDYQFPFADGLAKHGVKKSFEVGKHSGMDVKTSPGDEARAITNGEVVRAEDGKIIIRTTLQVSKIKLDENLKPMHEGGKASGKLIKETQEVTSLITYEGLQDVSKWEVGKFIPAGESIGVVAGDHLHLEVDEPILVTSKLELTDESELVNPRRKDLFRNLFWNNPIAKIVSKQDNLQTGGTDNSPKSRGSTLGQDVPKK